MLDTMQGWEETEPAAIVTNDPETGYTSVVGPFPDHAAAKEHLAKLDKSLNGSENDGPPIALSVVTMTVMPGWHRHDVPAQA